MLIKIQSRECGSSRIPGHDFVDFLDEAVLYFEGISGLVAPQSDSSNASCCIVKFGGRHSVPVTFANPDQDGRFGNFSIFPMVPNYDTLNTHETLYTSLSAPHHVGEVGNTYQINGRYRRAATALLFDRW